MYSGGPFGYRPISLNPHTYYLLDLSSKVSTLPRVCVPLPRPGNLDPAQSLLVHTWLLSTPQTAHTYSR